MGQTLGLVDGSVATAWPRWSPARVLVARLTVKQPPGDPARGLGVWRKDEDAEDGVVVFLTVLWSWQGAWPFQCLRFPIFKVGSLPHEAQMWKALTEKLWINVNL